MPAKFKHIGIVACSAPGAELCYSTICAEGPKVCGPHNHPEISMHNHPLSLYMDAIYKDDWKTVGDLMLDSAARLKRIGADFVICPDNTIHQGLDLVRQSSPLPWVHIAEVLAAEAKKSGHKKVGVTGTKYLMEGPVYPPQLSAQGIAHTIPPLEQRVEINRIIFEELVYGRFLPSALAYFQNVIRDLAAQGCDAVALSCTEIPILVAPADSSLPVLDSTRLQARAALQLAIA